MSYNDFDKYKAIEDTVIQPIQRFLDGEVEGAKTDWRSIASMAVYFSTYGKTIEEFHGRMQPYYWMYLTNQLPYDSEYNDLRGLLYRLMSTYEGLGEWFGREKDIFELVEIFARQRQEGAHFIAVLMQLIDQGYSDFIRQWDKERIEEEIEHLEVYGDRYRGEYFCILHAFLMIETSGLQEEQIVEYESLLRTHWDYLKHVYAVMVRRIIGSGHKNFRGVANNVEVLTSCHPYLHLFYNALLDRQEDILGNEREKEKMVKHVAKMEELMQNTEQEDTLDPLCQILFSEEFENVLARKRFKSYKELQGLASYWQEEATKLQGKVNELEPLKNLVDSMKQAVDNSIPVDDVVRTIIGFDDPKVSELVFNKLDWDLEEQPAWAKRRKDMKRLIKAKLQGPAEYEKTMLEYARQTTVASKKAAENPPIVEGDLVMKKEVQYEVNGVAQGGTGVSINEKQ